MVNSNLSYLNSKILFCYDRIIVKIIFLYNSKYFLNFCTWSSYSDIFTQLNFDTERNFFFTFFLGNETSRPSKSDRHGEVVREVHVNINGNVNFIINKFKNHIYYSIRYCCYSVIALQLEPYKADSEQSDLFVKWPFFFFFASIVSEDLEISLEDLVCCMFE